jgi:serine phosphatase RsbU (regulator of sigma subunit)/anti-sigma regulatory factor (Ser/Thr protein kinase)
MFRKPIRETVAAFPARENQLAGIRKTVEEICRQANLSSREMNNIILAIEEGATNIIRHAYVLGEGEIRLKVAVFRHHIIFSLFDNGKSFQPPDKSRLDLKKMAATGRRGGLGFYLINKVMDRVEYFSFEGENELRLTKFLSEKGEKEMQWSGGVSLRVKFSAWTLLIILIIVTGAYYYIDSRSSRYIHARLDKTVDALCNTIAAQAYGYIINRRSDVEFDELVVSYQRANDVLISVIIVNKRGEIRADSRGPSRLYTLYDPDKLQIIHESGPVAVFAPEGASPVIIRKIDHGGEYLGAVVMEYSSEVMETELRQTRRVILIITAVGLLIGIAGIYLLSNHFVRPIGRIVSRVRKLSAGDLDSQLPLTGAEEFYEISKALNELIMRIRRDSKNIVEREILHKEIQMAEEIQRALIPTAHPTVPGFDIGTIYKAARMVGGDLFDFVWIDEVTFGVTVADVSGKGVPGSLVMSMVRTALKLEARGNRSARDILIRVNDFIADHIKRGMFVTILLAVIDTRTGKINFASAGHNPIIHYITSRKEATFLNTRGVPVGIKTQHDEFADLIESAGITLAENDFLIIYTDGVTEGRGRTRKAYGTDRIIDIMNDNGNLSARELAGVIEADIARFIGGEDQHDDITMVILKNCPAGKDEPENNANKSETAETDSDTGHQLDSITVRSHKSSQSGN